MPSQIPGTLFRYRLGCGRKPGLQAATSPTSASRFPLWFHSCRVLRFQLSPREHLRGQISGKNGTKPPGNQEWTTGPTAKPTEKRAITGSVSAVFSPLWNAALEGSDAQKCNLL